MSDQHRRPTLLSWGNIVVIFWWTLFAPWRVKAMMYWEDRGMHDKAAFQQAKLLTYRHWLIVKREIDKKEDSNGKGSH